MSVVALRDEPAEPTQPWLFTPLSRADHGLGVATAQPLNGIVVVESTRRVQGPLAGHVLGLLGAEVIRVEPPGGDPLRGVPPMAGDVSARFAALNGGKQVIEIDLAHDRDTLTELVRHADVFVHNWAPGKAARWRLTPDDLAALRPGLVYAWASGWGDRLDPCPPLGTDYVVQAHSGLAVALRPAGEPAAPTLLTVTDVLGGLVCAQGVLAALLHRVRTGEGCVVDTSLLSSAGVVPVADRPLWTDWHGPLRTTDGWVALSRHAAEQPGRVAAALGRAVLDTHDTLANLTKAGLSAVPVTTDFRSLAEDPRFAGALLAGPCSGVRAPWTFA
jgi:crotonobetainyl-CoA:carnitine CoA-transferase CaiB-like acyl-CoA transferase